MGKITEALKKVSSERISRIQKKPEVHYVVRKVKNSNIEDHIAAFHDPVSPIAEQYKILRTNLQTLKANKNCKVFVLTSSISKEGKTVTSVNLAITLAHGLNSKSVLLIDADMRKGKMSQYLGIERSPGLSELLQDKVEIDSVLVSPTIENLNVIPAGRVPKNPSELLSSRKMQQLLAIFKNKFDYVLIDAPPVLNLTDAAILGSRADGVIMVIQAGRTQREAVKQSENLLAQAHAKTLGYVMTHIEYHLPQYLYRYVHHYGDYKYEHEQELVAGG
ncbi:CpsD/CapB family tyrosine-protein kinase, partial [Candidatus Omnitrophota bacterium]